MSNARPVVAHLVHHYAAPTETFVVNQIASLSRYRAVIGCHHRHRDSLYPLVPGVAAVDVMGVVAGSVDRLAYAHFTLPTPFAASAIASALSSENPALAHVHYLSDACFFHSTLRRLAVPFVISAYGYDVSSFPEYAFGLGGVLVRRAFREASAVLAMSSDMRSDLIDLGCPPDKIITHYHGSDTTRFALPRPREPRAGDVQLLSSCGGMREKKGLEVTLDALVRLRKRGVNDWRLTVLGDGARRSEMELLIRRLGLVEQVRLVGHVPYTGTQLPTRYWEADILVQPSLATADGDKEGIPGVLVEGMASGLAVIATRHAGIPSIIENGVSGVLVPERNPIALADALEGLLRDTTLRLRLGSEAARRAVSELDLRVRTPVLESIYDRVRRPVRGRKSCIFATDRT